MEDNSELQLNSENSVSNIKCQIILILVPDLLYKIFTLAVHSSTRPGSTALYISQVCRYWRNCALERPSLWGYIETKFPSLMCLFLSRSGKTTPLTLSWTNGSNSQFFEKHHIQNTSLDHNSSCFRLFALHIAPRLCSLILRLDLSQFCKIRDILWPNSSDILPLRLRHLDIQIRNLRQSDVAWTDILPIDPSYLRELTLVGLALPWSVPPNDKLTHFALMHPPKPPTINQIHTFLSHCPSLNELKLGLSEAPGGTIPPAPSTAPTLDKLEFPNLKRLRFELIGQSSYGSIQQLSACIRYLETLSSFHLTESGTYPLTDPSRLMPSGTLSHFANHHYFCMEYHPKRGFRICSGPSSDPTPHGSVEQWERRTINRLFPLYISCSPRQLTLSFDWSPILRIIHYMPAITHLYLISSAHEILTSSWPPDLDVRAAFPCLTTLTLSNVYDSSLFDCTDVLKSLPRGLKLQTLIVDQIHLIRSREAFVDAVCRIGIEVLQFGNYDPSYHEGIVYALRKRGITVIHNQAQG